MDILMIVAAIATVMTIIWAIQRGLHEDPQVRNDRLLDEANRRGLTLVRDCGCQGWLCKDRHGETVWLK